VDSRDSKHSVVIYKVEGYEQQKFVQLAKYTVVNRYAGALIAGVYALLERGDVCFEALLRSIETFISAIVELNKLKEKS
jgi:hypothetical protein